MVGSGTVYMTYHGIGQEKITTIKKDGSARYISYHGGSSSGSSSSSYSSGGSYSNGGYSSGK